MMKLATLSDRLLGKSMDQTINCNDNQGYGCYKDRHRDTPWGIITIILLE